MGYAQRFITLEWQNSITLKVMCKKRKLDFIRVVTIPSQATIPSGKTLETAENDIKLPPAGQSSMTLSTPHLRDTLVNMLHPQRNKYIVSHWLHPTDSKSIVSVLREGTISCRWVVYTLQFTKARSCVMVPSVNRYFNMIQALKQQ